MLVAILAQLCDARIIDDTTPKWQSVDLIINLSRLCAYKSNLLCHSQGVFAAEKVAEFMLVAKKILRGKNFWRKQNVRFTLLFIFLPFLIKDLVCYLV